MGKRKSAAATSNRRVRDSRRTASKKSPEPVRSARKSTRKRKDEQEGVSKAASSSKRRRRSQKSSDENDDDVEMNNVTVGEKEIEKKDEGEENEEDDAPAVSKYQVRDRVLARDEDGLLYHANIRRKLYGTNHQKTVSCLKIFDSYQGDQDSSNDTGNATKNGSTGLEDNEDSSIGNDTEPEWYYFVHFEGWKSLWDRWVSESDIMEATPVNEERMKEIMQANRALQHEVKEKSRTRKIHNAGLFMQLWKQRLDRLEEKWKQQDEKGKDKGTHKKESAAAKKKKKNRAARKKKTKSDAQVIQEQSDLAVQSCLTNRKQAHVQAIPLAFGLKRVLVEDWEILNAANRNEDDSNSESNVNDSMVHVLPTKVTIRHTLSLYLKEKGIEWNGITKKASKSKNKEAKDEHGQSPANVGDVTKRPAAQDEQFSNDNVSQPKLEKSIDSKPKDEEDAADAMDVSEPLPGPTTSSQLSETDPPKSPASTSAADNKEDASTPEVVATEDDQLTKEWTDMANGISIYFEQALTSRLLYPSEVSQLILLEESLEQESSSLDKIDVYGCEHLLRLISTLPRILDQQYQDAKKKRQERKNDAATDGAAKAQENDDDEDEEDGFAQTGGLILAKLQDLARYLQKNQSTLFCSRYRKKNDAELTHERKIQKRQERRLKNRAAMLLQQDDGATGNAVSTET